MKQNRNFFFAIILVAFAITSCNTNTKECNATIIERKQMNDTMLQLVYTYEAKGEKFMDSITTNNKKILSDSVIVQYTAENPKENKLHIP
ncbi:MAG: hypothetical protein AMXMBFR79_11870 [Chitinophagaceae bacterium]|nr:hypothetical protein [Chitinophagaceae bacterium]MCZ2298360.1 hypothetical protein [Chitinophagales bacterium]